MDNKTKLGSLSELKVAARLTELDYHVFTQTSGKAPFDLIAYKDGVIFRISVKGTSVIDKYGSYVVQIGSVRSNKTANNIVKFDFSTCDILAIYIQSNDKVCFIKSDRINAGRAICIRDIASKYAGKNKESWVISELQNF
jgi:hypothetical protein